MTYKEIDRDLLIRKRRIAFELGESNLPKYAKKFIERVLDSEELTPTFSEAEIRADERRKTIDEVKILIGARLIDNLNLTDATKYGNENAKQQANSYATVMKYEIADCVDDLIEDLERLREQK